MRKTGAERPVVPTQCFPLAVIYSSTSYSFISAVC